MARKIVHISALYPPALGGMEKVVEQLAGEQSAQGNRVEVITSNIDYDPSYIDPVQPMLSIRRLWGKSIANLPIIPGLLLRLLRSAPRSVFHVHIAQAFLPEIVLLAGRLRGQRCIAHFHLDVVASGRFGALFTLYKKTLFPWALRSYDAVVVFSEEQRKLVHEKYGVSEAKIRVIPNGVGTNFTHPDRVLSPNKPLRLLFVGRLSPQKNVSFLIDALAHVTIPYSLTLVGEGALRARLTTQVHSLNMDKHVSFAGRKDGNELINAYASHDVFVLPSEREGMPLVLLEAMATALPAVGCDVLGTRDIIMDGKNGLLVPLNDVKALAHAIDRVGSDPALYASMSHSAAQTVSPFRWPALAKRFESEVYR